MILDDTSLRYHIVEPVGFTTCSLCLSLVLVLYKVVIHGLTRVLGYIVLIALGNLRSVAVVHLVGKVLKADVAIIADAGLAFLTVLGGDQDDTVGTVRTINSCSRGILQDFHRLDVARVDIVE